jgi:hypothetical protein
VDTHRNEVLARLLDCFAYDAWTFGRREACHHSSMLVELHGPFVIASFVLYQGSAMGLLRSVQPSDAFTLSIRHLLQVSLLFLVLRLERLATQHRATSC